MICSFRYLKCAYGRSSTSTRRGGKGCSAKMVGRRRSATGGARVQTGHRSVMLVERDRSALKDVQYRLVIAAWIRDVEGFQGFHMIRVAGLFIHKK